MPRAWSRGFTSRCISSATPETSCNIKMLVSCLHLFATVAASCQVHIASPFLLFWSAVVEFYKEMSYYY